MKRIKLILVIAAAATLTGCMIVPLGYRHGHHGYRHYSGNLTVMDFRSFAS